jgi:N4-gp56 family major capsid protein
MQYREMLGDSIGYITEDLLQKDMLSGSNVYYVGSATGRSEVGRDSTSASGVETAPGDGDGDDASRVSYDDIRKIVATLVANRAQKYTSIIEGSTKVGTVPVHASYVGIVGPEVRFDLESIADNFGNKAWIPVSQYGSSGTIMPNEVGSIAEMRFVESERAQQFVGSGNDIPNSYTGKLANDGAKFTVFPILCPTQGAFATVGLSGKGKMDFKSSPPGKVEQNDKFGLKGFFSVNWWYAGIILDESKLLRVETCATDLGIGRYGSAGMKNGPAAMTDVTDPPAPVIP